MVLLLNRNIGFQTDSERIHHSAPKGRSTISASTSYSFKVPSLDSVRADLCSQNIDCSSSQATGPSRLDVLLLANKSSCCILGCALLSASGELVVGQPLTVLQCHSHGPVKGIWKITHLRYPPLRGLMKYKPAQRTARGGPEGIEADFYMAVTCYGYLDPCRYNSEEHAWLFFA